MSAALLISSAVALELIRDLPHQNSQRSTIDGGVPRIAIGPGKHEHPAAALDQITIEIVTRYSTRKNSVGVLRNCQCRPID